MTFTATITAAAGIDTIAVSTGGFRTAQNAHDWATATIARHPGFAAFNPTVTIF